MVTTSQLSCRTQMAIELADLWERQKLCLSLDQYLLETLVEPDRLSLLQSLLSDDEKTLSLLETARMEHGLPAQSNAFTQHFLTFAMNTFSSQNANLMGNLELACLLKNAQIKSGHLLASILPHLPPDAHPAFAMLPAITSCNTGHLRKLDKLSQELFFQNFLGVSAPLGITTQLKQRWADFAGTVSRPFARGAEEMPITMVLKQEHLKTQALFGEIEGTDNPELAFDLFTQLKIDLSTHATAEEETFYLPISSLMESERLIESSFDDHDNMRVLISEIQDLSPASRQFKTAIRSLHKEVTVHVEKEESAVFSVAERKFNLPALKLISANFKQAKLNLIDEFFPSMMPKAS